jgi:hypothetical protein
VVHRGPGIRRGPRVVRGWKPGSRLTERIFENEQFTAFHDRGGNVYENLHFRKCTFISSSVSITYDPANRTTVRNVTLERCRVVGSSLRCAVVEDVLVDGLQTSDLHHAWGALFKHVTLRGKVGRLLVTELVGPHLLHTPLQEAFDRQREAYYRDVDWALDISEIEAVELALEGIPARLIRRDPETQAVVTRQAALSGEWRELRRVQETALGLMIQDMLGRGYDDTVLVAERRARDFKQVLAGIEELRAAGVAEPD